MSLNSPIFLKEKEENNSKFVEIQQSQTTSVAAEDPLQNLYLASQEVLQKAQQSGRSKCLKCGSSRMFYCYTCYVPVENVPIEQIPLVKVGKKFNCLKIGKEILKRHLIYSCSNIIDKLNNNIIVEMNNINRKFKLTDW